MSRTLSFRGFANTDVNKSLKQEVIKVVVSLSLLQPCILPLITILIQHIAEEGSVRVPDTQKSQPTRGHTPLDPLSCCCCRCNRSVKTDLRYLHR